MQGYIEVGGGNKYFTRNIIYPLDKRQKAFEEIRTKTDGVDMYYCTYVFDKEDRSEGTKYYSPLYFDIDGSIDSDESFDKTRIAVLSLIARLNVDLRIKASEIKVYFSGAKGFHIFINPRVLGIKPSATLNVFYKAFAMYMKSHIEHGDLLDIKIYDNKRLIRFPNTVNGKTGLYKIPVTVKELRSVKRDDILSRAKTPQQEYAVSDIFNSEASSRFKDLLKTLCNKQTKRKHNCIPESTQKLPPCARFLFYAHAEKGERNNMVALLSSILAQNGYTGDRALNIIYSWNENNPDPLEDHEIEATCRSTERMAAAGKGYGCSSIREKGLFPPRQVCINCKIYKSQHR